MKTRATLPHEDVTRHVRALKRGRQIAALFDLDGTIIAGYSALVFLREQWRHGHIGVTELVELTASAANLAAGRIGFGAALAASAGMLRGVKERDYQRFGAEMFEQHLAQQVYPEARALVQAHLQRGHTVAIVSSATPYQARPVAADLGIEHVLCTDLAVANGKFTGALRDGPCWGPGKVRAAEQFAAEQGVDLDRSLFYSDSHDDLPLLERVGHPRVLNPDAKLEEIAVDRGWPVRRFHSKDAPGPTDYLRALGVYGSLVGSAMVGLGVWGLSGSKDDGRHSMVSLWTDVASALTGLRLDVQGEEKLWAHQPAVIIANHQSKADALIVMKLLRGQCVAVAKQEITQVPLVSQAIQFAGVIPIDRANAQKAIDSMQPLLHAIRHEKKFAVVAVEGTRSRSTTPGPFKKGAFHIAMQAGVPIIPLVIHNSIDMQPRGEFTFRPATVRVEVLDPIDVSTWRARDLDRHVAAVRDLYLRALGLPGAPTARVRKRARRN